MTNQQYSKIDRGHFIPSPYVDISWGEGTLKSSRPFRVECWAENAYTFLTFFMSTLGIEDATEQDLKDLLVSEGLIDFDDDKFVKSGNTGCNVEAKKMIDASKNEMWSITVIVGDEDDSYIRTHFPLNRHDFTSKQLARAVALPGERKTKDVESTEYFLAISEYVDENNYTWYPLYFINNTLEQIRVMLAIKPGCMTQIKKGATIDDIDDEFIKNNVGIGKFRDVPPKSYIDVNCYHNWNFDWSNALYLFLETRGEEKHLSFYMGKYFIAFNKKVNDIPVLHKRGWVCLQKEG